MVRIRLRRTGKKKQPSYRVVVADSRSPRDGKFIEIIGHYHPILQPKELVIKNERARYWLSVGAQPSDTVVKLLKRVNVLDTDGNVTAEDAVSETVAPVAETPAPKKAPKATKAAAAEPVATEPAEPVAAEPEAVVAAPVAIAAEPVAIAAEPEAEPAEPVASE